MKIYKHLLAIILALSVVLSLAIPGFAAGEEGESGDSSTTTSGNSGQVTINSVRENETYSVYQILGLTYDPVTGGVFYNSVNSNFHDFFRDKPGVSDPTNPSQVFNYIKENMPKTTAEHPELADVNRQARKTFARTIAQYVKTNNFAATKSGTVPPGANSVTITDLPYGYYLIVPTLSKSGYDNDEEGYAVFMLDSTAVDTSITNKSKYPSPRKTVVDASNHSGTANVCAIGDVMTFTVRDQMPDVSAYTKYKFEIHDKLNHMSYQNGTAKLKIAGSEISLNDNSNTVVTKTDADGVEQSITIHLNVDTNNAGYDSLTLTIDNLVPFYGIYNAQTDVSFIYNAKLDKDAVVGGEGNYNEVYFTYSNDPLDPNSTSSSKLVKTATFTLGLNILKTDTAGSHKLQGAEFELKKKTGVSGDTPIYQTVFRTDYTAEQMVNSYPNIVYNEDEDVSNSNPNFVINGLGDGEYLLHELKAPDGRVPLHEDITFTVDATGSVTDNVGSLSFGNDQQTKLTGGNNYAGFASNAQSGIISLSVKNSTQEELPSTGGAGLYIVAGVAIVALLGFGGTAMLKRKVNGED